MATCFKERLNAGLMTGWMAIDNRLDYCSQVLLPICVAHGVFSTAFWRLADSTESKSPPISLRDCMASSHQEPCTLWRQETVRLFAHVRKETFRSEGFQPSVIPTRNKYPPPQMTNLSWPRIQVRIPGLNAFSCLGCHLLRNYPIHSNILVSGP